jgi:hypothetical protein
VRGQACEAGELVPEVPHKLFEGHFNLQANGRFLSGKQLTHQGEYLGIALKITSYICKQIDFKNVRIIYQNRKVSV